MASIETTRVWKGITVKESTDTSTGKITLKSTSGIDLASSSSNSWSLDNGAAFSRLLNNTNTDLSEVDFSQTFFNEGVDVFNGDRSDILNDSNNFSSITEAINSQTSFFNIGIPGISDPRTGQQVNSNGDTTTANPDGGNLGSSSNISNFSTRTLPINSSASGGSSGGGGPSLRYPVAQLPDLDYDFVQFEIYDYVNNGQLAVQNAEERLGAKLLTITLPMVGNLAEQNSVEWGMDKMNEMQRILGDAAMTTMGDPTQIASAVGDLAVGAKQMVENNPNVERQLAAYFAGQALGVNLQARSTGQVLNPNMELLFVGPRLRSFNFDFKFRPRFEDESIMVRSIIKAFKRAMAPQRGGTGLFLQTPNVFKIKYTHAGGDHPFMNFIKPCALTNFNVSYTPDNAYMTYPDGGLTGYDIQFSMGEIAPIYQDDHDTVGGTGY